MIEVYKQLNGHSPDIMNDIFKLREDMYNPQNFHIFQTDNPRLLKDGLDAIPYCTDQLQHFSKIALKLGNVKTLHADLAKYLFKMSVYLIGTHQ